MKKNILIVPLLLVTLSTNQSMLAFASIEANDISGHWAEKTIVEWQSKNKISGYEDNTFRPDSPISRAEFVHLLNSIIFMEQGEFIDFNDVSANDWFYADITKAVSNHIIAGFEDNTFRPNEMITRAQAALIISNALNLTTTTNKITLTDDNDIPEWSKNAVYAMLNAGYLSGYKDGSFAANKSMTRAEAISMLDRIDKNITLSENTYQTNSEDVNKTTENNNDNIIHTNTNQNSFNEEEKTSAKMVWENDGGSSSHTSKNKQTKPSEDIKNIENIITINKDNISKFYGQTLKDTVILELEDTSIELIDMKFTGNIEIVSKIQLDTAPTIYLKGTTSIKYITTSFPVIINSENNNITTLVTKAETTVSGNTQIKNLQCQAKTNIIDNTNITDTAQIFSTLTANDNTKINIVELIANTESNITTNGIINKIITNGKGNISYIHLAGNANTNINITDSVILENITLSENAKAHITIQKNGKLKEMLSSSKCLGTTITNYGTVEHISVTNTETITAKNAVVESAILQSINILSQPYNLHYSQNETLSLAGISLLLQYENNITQTINNIDDFDLYDIKTIPAQNTILTSEYHNRPIKIYCNDIYANTDSITIDSITNDIIYTEPINKQPLFNLIEECKIILNETHIKITEDNILQEQYYIDENDFNSFKNTISTSENLLSKKDITQNEIQQQYIILQAALQEFESKRTLSPKVISAPILSVSNVSPEYGTKDVTFTIENIDSNLTYYYTLDGTDPTTESKIFTEDVTLVPPQEIEETTITIKMIAVQEENYSAITEQTVTYSAALPIEEIALYNIKSPFIGEEPDINVSSENENQYVIASCNWKSKDPDDSEQNKDNEKIENSFDSIKNIVNLDDTEITKFKFDKSYIAEIHLKSINPYIFELKSNTELNLKGVVNEAGEKLSIEEDIESVEIEEQRSDINNLYILVTFKTIPEPTEERAIKELKKLMPQQNILKVSVPSSMITDENFCNEAIVKAAQSVVSKYWDVEFELLFFNKLNDTTALASGKFTINSNINSDIFYSKYTDIVIDIASESD